MRKLTVVLALALTFLVVNVGVASAACWTPTRPYKDKGSATLDLANGLDNITIDGTRIATHLGKSTWHASNVLVDTSQLGTGIVGVTYDDTITAANGDTVTTKAVATIDVSDLSGVPLPFSAVETVTGGTGRFAHASGSIDVTGSVDITTAVLTFTSTGYISY
jgi:hypothetical protein